MTDHEPRMDLVWQSLTGYQRTAAFKAAFELDLFTAVGEGVSTAAALATRCKAAERGIRALCNRLVADGFLAREGDGWTLTPTAALFLDRNSPAYVASAVAFLTNPTITDAFARVTDAVRRGGTALPEETVSEENPVWVDFAKAMAPVARFTATLLANLLEAASAPAWNVLDVAAGHGMYGIALASENPKARVAGLDWKSVLAVARENAAQAGVGDRYRTIEGSAFTVDWGTGYDVVLLPNFLHHFDPPTCESILVRARRALVPGGRLVIVEFVPNDDRSGPPDALAFSLVMLASTAAGDAYTFAEYRQMLRASGFSDPTLHELTPAPTRVILARA